MNRKVRFVLSIAGSDPSSGAGIQSDIKTFLHHGVYGLTVLTAVTSQNTKGVRSSMELPAGVVRSQLKTVFDDFDIKVVKTGMLSSGRVISAVSNFLKTKKNIKLVVDPVIRSKNGYRLLDRKGLEKLKEELFKIAFLVTPNLMEAEELSGVRIKNAEDLEYAAVIIRNFGAKNVLIKGGHFKKTLGLEPGTDILFDGREFFLFGSRWIKTKNTHGIGCTLAAAIASNVALGKPLPESVSLSKEYLAGLLGSSVNIGKGSGPVEQY